MKQFIASKVSVDTQRYQHVPLNVAALTDAMPLLFELMTHEPQAQVKTVLGHFVFVNIHPYLDGNGRMGQFLMM